VPDAPQRLARVRAGGVGDGPGAKNLSAVAARAGRWTADRRGATLALAALADGSLVSADPGFCTVIAGATLGLADRAGLGQALGVHAGPPSRGDHGNPRVSFGIVHDADRSARADNGRVTCHTVHIDIDVRIDGDQITEHAGDGVSQPSPFLGWLGLIGALDRLVGDPSSAEGPVRGSATAMGSAGRQAGAGRAGDQ